MNFGVVLCLALFFHSQDSGDNWTLVRSLWDDPRRKKWMGGGYDFAGIHSILVDPRDPAHVTVGVSIGGVWQYYRLTLV